MKASLPVAIVFSAAGASMMNGSQRGPANTRTPCAEPPCSSSTLKASVSPAAVVHVPSWSGPRAALPFAGGEKTQSKVSSAAPTANGAGSSLAAAATGRNRKR